jgi:hypothetical protein
MMSPAADAGTSKRGAWHWHPETARSAGALAHGDILSRQLDGTPSWHCCCCPRIPNHSHAPVYPNTHRLPQVMHCLLPSRQQGAAEVGARGARYAPGWARRRRRQPCGRRPHRQAQRRRRRRCGCLRPAAGRRRHRHAGRGSAAGPGARRHRHKGAPVMLQPLWHKTGAKVRPVWTHPWQTSTAIYGDVHHPP